MSTETDTAAASDPGDSGIEREIGHDEYDPIGTVVLITLYFLIVALMWIFIYFVEFLGGGPTVV